MGWADDSARQIRGKLGQADSQYCSMSHVILSAWPAKPFRVTRAGLGWAAVGWARDLSPLRDG